ncbi:MAG: tetratricopeptide repeat protein [Verrucomicrobia bacterium]|nr:tetratricopeptide repeat protein [Verrucomicrobiota bacterium]MDA1086804.1 tetratricopeptide repeat protein [Verrucomicrobiota bacterium]
MKRYAPKAILALIMGVTLLAYYGARYNGFVFFDDGEYIVENTFVASGLTLKNIRWAFTHYHSHNWHPVTWITHMADSQAFGLQAGGHHSTSVLIHILNAALMFTILRASTRNLAASALVALLWALHPLHVESVAWASERKNVLSTFFWLLTMSCYVRYAHIKSDTQKEPHKFQAAAWYLLMLIAFALGLMSKQMLVTLPCALLLFDVWPLGREPFRSTRQLVCILVEKIPLFLLAIAAAVTVYIVQSSSGVMKAQTDFAMLDRLKNAVIAYGTYISHLVFPTRLAVFYPHAGQSATTPQVIAVAACLVVISALATLQVRQRPFLLVGWLWFLGTMLPVLGIIQVGFQGMADRYMYVPCIGLVVAGVWLLVPEAPSRRRSLTIALLATMALPLLILTRRQVATWRNDVALLSHAVEVVPDNYWAHYNLARTYENSDDLATARRHYEQAILARFDFPEAHYNLGVLHARMGDLRAATASYRNAIGTRPTHVEAHINLGALLAGQGHAAEAISLYERAVLLAPEIPQAQVGLAHLLMEAGDLARARTHAQRALALREEWDFALELLKRIEDASSEAVDDTN